MNKSVKTICLLLTLVMCVTAMPLAAVARDDGTLRIVSSNVLFDDTRDTVYRMHCLAGSMPISFVFRRRVRVRWRRCIR